MRTRSPSRLRETRGRSRRPHTPWDGGRRGILLIGVLVLSGFAGGCGFLYSTPEVRVLDVEIRELGFTSGSLDVLLEVTNPNRFGVELRGVRYRLELADPQHADGWVVLASGETRDGGRVGGRGVERVPLNLPFEYGSLGPALRIVLRGDDLRYRILGDLTAGGPLGEMEFPFESGGHLEI